MSKELERLIPDDPLDCLKVLRASANTYCYFNNDQCEYNKELANNIEKALKRLEAIDNANPSKALEALGFIGNYIIPTPNGNEFLKDFCDIELNIIKQALLKAQEQEKALKVIKEKNVDIWLLKSCLTVELYNYSITKIDSCDVFNLTQEEFDLLKEFF